MTHLDRVQTDYITTKQLQILPLIGHLWNTILSVASAGRDQRPHEINSFAKFWISYRGAWHSMYITLVSWYVYGAKPHLALCYFSIYWNGTIWYLFDILTIYSQSSSGCWIYHLFTISPNKWYPDSNKNKQQRGVFILGKEEALKDPATASLPSDSSSKIQLRMLSVDFTGTGLKKYCTITIVRPPCATSLAKQSLLPRYPSGIPFTAKATSALLEMFRCIYRLLLRKTS